MDTTERDAKRENKYYIEVLTTGDDKWYGNACVYDTEKEAQDAAISLYSRWMATRDWRVQFQNEHGTISTVDSKSTYKMSL